MYYQVWITVCTVLYVLYVLYCMYCMYCTVCTLLYVFSLLIEIQTYNYWWQTLRQLNRVKVQIILVNANLPLPATDRT